MKSKGRAAAEHGLRGLAKWTWGVFALSLALYAWGAAPEFATDDSAEFQRLAPAMQPMHSPGYPTQMLLGGAAKALVGSEVAPRAMTLLSALWAALGVALLCRTVSLAAKSLGAGLVAASALAVSHTFWMHGGLAEAYSLNALAVIALLALFEASQRRPGFAPRALAASALLTGFACGNHLTILLFAPMLGIAYAASFPCARRPGVFFVAAAVGAATAGTMFLVLAFRFAPAMDASAVMADPSAVVYREPLELAWDSARGGESRGLLFAFGPVALAKRLGTAGGYFVYQFPSPALGLIAFGAFALWIRRRWAWLWLLGSLAAVNLAYAVNFDSSDVYVFYVPCHVAGAVAAGFGARWIAGRFKRAFLSRSAWGLLIAGCAAAPPLVYAAVPKALDAAGVSLSRNKGNAYYLWPPKRGELALWNAQAEALAKSLPDNAFVLVNWNTFHLMGAWIDRAGRSGKVRLHNLPRQGPAFGRDNWSANIRDTLMRYPAGEVWALGEAPGLRGDPLFREREAAGARRYDLAINAGEGSFDAFREAFAKAYREALDKRGLLPEGEALPFRPFYDSRGEIAEWNPGG